MVEKLANVLIADVWPKYLFYAFSSGLQRTIVGWGFSLLVECLLSKNKVLVWSLGRQVEESQCCITLQEKCE